jgi:hypothetical protein
MQEKFNKQLSTAAKAEIVNGAIDIKTLLKQVFEISNEGLITDETLARDIQQYYLGEGSPEIHEIKLSALTYHAETQTGSMRLDFRIKRFYTCSAIQNSSRDYQNWTFHIDATNSTITFAGPLEEERWPDEI